MVIPRHPKHEPFAVRIEFGIHALKRKLGHGSQPSLG
jgi:hypothetical protein